MKTQSKLYRKKFKFSFEVVDLDVAYMKKTVYNFKSRRYMSNKQQFDLTICLCMFLIKICSGSLSEFKLKWYVEGKIHYIHCQFFQEVSMTELI